jgi:hypothetical protein
MTRWIRFLVAILVGVGLGLLYGWMIRPVDYVDTSPDTLRIDYKTDYILMVAEAYRGDGDLQRVARNLALLGDTAPVDMVYEAMLFAEKAGYADADLATMQSLLVALQAYDLAQDTPAP